MNRRAYLTAVTAGTIGLAGCTDASFLESGGEGDDGESTNGDGDDGDDRNLPDAAGTDDDFEDLDRWEVSGGTLTADEDRALVGSQSARLEMTEGTARLTKTFSEARDLSAVVPGVAGAAGELVVPWLRLIDTDRNAIEYRRGVSADLPLMRYNYGITDIEDGFDDESVEEVHIQLGAGEGQERTVWFDDFHFTPRPETGKVMIQFDDGHETDYTKALPILEEYGYPAVTFVNKDYIDGGDVGGDPRLTTDELHELHDAGWCIANHTVSHPNLSELNAEEQKAEIRDSKEWLVEEGFEEGARYFAYPFGDYDETTIELVDEHHEIGFAGGQPVQGFTTNTKLASRIGEPDAERVETELERTAERGGITCIFYHRLEGSDLESFETLVETLHEYESAGELDVILPQDLEEQFLF
ncbi:Peptidoglycan/xylan/chitin deacetylase, PgdA/CDA1 family [Natronorubrum sediminis]|uniref:Peptidoglycan/xylan/chitin deacetylase, PgdA/CDA1 family n=1 Tax=Natronorubrum sediminis TaxID=640943 RepID=A0A1H6FPX0_9EURY|nr:polysaccharide deacetylase family protein [Natronorubrum sediminis]SEH12947.1 Peptidoglycan/xylan/chitin deacetylase, PgdA/CDA1 family [Natronorubrum sediminis]